MLLLGFCWLLEIILKIAVQHFHDLDLVLLLKPANLVDTHGQHTPRGEGPRRAGLLLGLNICGLVLVLCHFRFPPVCWFLFAAKLISTYTEVFFLRQQKSDNWLRKL